MTAKSGAKLVTDHGPVYKNTNREIISAKNYLGKLIEDGSLSAEDARTIALALGLDR